MIILANLALQQDFFSEKKIYHYKNKDKKLFEIFSACNFLIFLDKAKVLEICFVELLGLNISRKRCKTNFLTKTTITKMMMSKL